MRELREFRVRHDVYVANDLAVAAVSRDTPESNRTWAERLSLPYPILCDREGALADPLGVVRRIGIRDWSVEFFRRSTFLVDARGAVAAVWSDVKIRGHALEVLEVAKTLRAG